MDGDPASESELESASELDAQAGAEESNPATRVLALDVGGRRIGLALSDPLGITAQPLFTLQRTTERADLKSIARLVRKHGVRAIVVGNPLHLSGALSPQAAKVQRFAEALRDVTGVNVHLVDERLTTAEAHTLLDRSGRPGVRSRSLRREREAVIDQVAAVLLLEAFLSVRSPRLLPPPAEP